MTVKSFPTILRHHYKPLRFFPPYKTVIIQKDWEKGKAGAIASMHQEVDLEFPLLHLCLVAMAMRYLRKKKKFALSLLGCFLKLNFSFEKIVMHIPSSIYKMCNSAPLSHGGTKAKISFYILS